MSQGGRRPHSQSGRDVLEARSASVLLPDGDDTERLHLAVRKLLKCLHRASKVSKLYISITNY